MIALIDFMPLGSQDLYILATKDGDMRKLVFLMVLIAAVIVAGCAGTKDTTNTAPSSPQDNAPANQQASAPTGDLSAISGETNDVDSGIQSIDSAGSELQPDINASDMDLGI